MAIHKAPHPPGETHRHVNRINSSKFLLFCLKQLHFLSMSCLNTAVKMAFILNMSLNEAKLSDRQPAEASPVGRRATSDPHREKPHPGA
jgi:hypothetical protein